MSTVALYQPEKVIPLDFDIRFHPDLTWGEKFFLAELKSMCRKGKCHYHQSNLAEIFNISVVSVHSWVKKLCSLGYIEISMDENDPDCKLYIKLKEKKAK